MNNKNQILIVDDTPEMLSLLTMLLEEEYQVTTVDSGDKALMAIEKQVPHLVLLDVNMPGMNGYQVCQTLRKDHRFKKLPIVFVSAMDSVEERLAGFESGADDYLIKPIAPPLLLETIQKNLDKFSCGGCDDNTEALNMAMEAMTISSELGQIIEFVKQGGRFNSITQIGQSILTISQDFNLNCALMILGDKPQFMGCEPDSIEARFLLKTTDSTSKIFSLGVRTLVRSNNFILLIKNMPITHENLYGRLKDHLAVLIDIAQGFYEKTHSQNQQAQLRQKLISEIILHTEQQILLTSQKIQHHQIQSQKIMMGMIHQMDQMLLTLGLEEDQEEKLMDLANKASFELAQNNEDTQKLEAELSIIITKLYQFMEGGS